jgi:hypothetical protein
MQSQEILHLSGEEEEQQSPSVNIETEDNVVGPDHSAINVTTIAETPETGTGKESIKLQCNLSTSEFILSSHQSTRNK